MPKLGEYSWLLDLPFFLYPNKESALSGSKFGGTGFLVAIPYKNNPTASHHIYGVTNAHVALGTDRSGVIRFNRIDGKTDTFETKEKDWFSIPGLYDIAVMPIDFLNLSIHKVQAINISPDDSTSFYIGPEEIKKFEINAGDDVFMIGRFVDYDGMETNQPSLRFGNISILSANVYHPAGYTGTSTVLDMRSRSGYSGSPVFIYRTAGSIFLKEKSIAGGGHYLKLLGIHWWQYPEQWKIQGSNITSPSGMTAAHTTNAILEVLNQPALQQLRAAKEAK